MQPQADWNSGRPGSRLGVFLGASRILLILYDTDVPYLGDIEDGVEAREDFLCRRYEVAGSKRPPNPFRNLVRGFGGGSLLAEASLQVPANRTANRDINHRHSNQYRKPAYCRLDRDQLHSHSSHSTKTRDSVIAGLCPDRARPQNSLPPLPNSMALLISVSTKSPESQNCAGSG